MPVVVVGALASAVPCHAASDVAAGKAYAQANCVRCHSIDKSTPSSLPIAPPFRTLHERYPVESLEEAPGAGLVLGHEADAVAAKLIESGVAARFVINEAYATGQLSSVLRGLNAIDRPGVRAMLLTLVDVPLVSPATIRAVIDRYKATQALIVRPVRGDEHGHPVLIDRSLFGLVRTADPSAGIKPVVRAHVSAAGDVDVADAGAFVDIDTPAAYERVLNDTAVRKP